MSHSFQNSLSRETVALILCLIYVPKQINRIGAGFSNVRNMVGSRLRSNSNAAGAAVRAFSPSSAASSKHGLSPEDGPKEFLSKFLPVRTHTEQDRRREELRRSRMTPEQRAREDAEV